MKKTSPVSYVEAGTSEYKLVPRTKNLVKVLMHEENCHRELREILFHLDNEFLKGIKNILDYVRCTFLVSFVNFEQLSCRSIHNKKPKD